MCGIAGIVKAGVLRNKEHLKTMMQAIQHRGPDSSNFHLFENCALGHLRLSIVDLNSGDQPMFSASNQSAIVFNGEIYGFQKIKQEQNKYPFTTTSDTEVILALYEEYGNAFVNKLPGMFSFAIWNDLRQELICARDRFGEKPFFYAYGDKGEFLFASEIKALIASGLITPVLNQDALSHYLKHLYVHPYQTIYSNIQVLPPAHQLIIRNGKFTISRYWDLPIQNFKIDLGEAEEEFRRLLSKAVEKQMIADVPVGAFLSGGIDSSTIVGIASQFNKNLQTFSFGFGKEINELPFAKEVSDLYNTNHTELEDKNEDIGELLLLMQKIYDEPFADSSNIPTYLISKYASKYLKVVLTGDGGDELLAGYSWYKDLLEIASPNSFSRVNFRNVVKNLFSKSHIGDINNCVARHSRANIHFSNQELSELGIKSFPLPLINLKKYNSNTPDDALRMDIENYMPGDILVKTDRAAMASGLELRAPFLDVDFASFCISLPYQIKITNETQKLILKNAMGNLLPEKIKTRKKQGFGAPAESWLQQESVKRLKRQFLNNPDQKIFEVLSFRKVQEIAEKNTYQTWILLILALWMDNYSFKINKNAHS